MSKMVMIVYNEAIDNEVAELLENSGLKNYTKITGVFGSGTASGTHLGNDIWPGRNNILYIACEEGKANQLLSCVREVRKKLASEGIKAFIFPLEEFT
jgi:nitrogen regulatory protein PII